jgi:hypothetical protein
MLYITGMKNSLHLPAYEDGTVCSETSTYKIQTPGNYPEGSTQNILLILNVSVLVDQVPELY